MLIVFTKENAIYVIIIIINIFQDHITIYTIGIIQLYILIPIRYKKKKEDFNFQLRHVIYT